MKIRTTAVPGTTICLAILTAGMLSAAYATDSDMNPELRNQAKHATDSGLRYLRETQDENGSWSGSVGITALALRAYLDSYRGYNEGDGAFITRSVDFLLANVNSDGSISETTNNRNYNTAVAMVALQTTGNPDYTSVIHNAQRFLKGLQLEENDGYSADHKYFGGIGYGGDERPDLSNQYLAIEALRATAVDPEDPVWKRALVFVSRSQNLKASNDQDWAEDDGGFTYMPGYSPNGGTRSYGSMTHAGLISLLFAGVDREDPRIQGAYNWIRETYTLDRNPGAVGNQGLFYYYNAFAKSMAAFGEVELVDGRGRKHNWRDDLANKLISLQDKDGSWVNNDSPRWWEGNRDLVTAWSVIALNLVVR